MNPMHTAIEAIEGAAKYYLKDLDSMTDEQILTSAGGNARKAVDFTYEVALINRRIAARLTGAEPPALPEGDGWICAPGELCSKEAVSAYFRDACAELAAAAKSVPEADINKLVGPAENQRPAYAMVQFAATHVAYHDAQLNFIQSLSGDLSMHWN